jgi:hypothetical protein
VQASRVFLIVECLSPTLQIGQKKLPKLAVWKARGARTVLILEGVDDQLTNPVDVAKSVLISMPKHPAFDGPVILFQDVVKVVHRSMSAVLLQSTVRFELDDGWRVAGVLVGIDAFSFSFAV